MQNPVESRKRDRLVRSEPGVIRFGGQSRSCGIVNVSQLGAMLSLVDPKDLPDEFELSLCANSIPRRCTTTWRKSYFVGVKFVSGC